MDFQLNRDSQSMGKGTHGAPDRNGMPVAGGIANLGNQSRLQDGLPIGMTGLGNQGVIQLCGKGTYANREAEKGRLSEAHEGADTSGAHFQIEHALGFESANPLKMNRITVGAYEGILFAYAEVYLAHRLHIGTGRNLKNYRKRFLKSAPVPEEKLDIFETRIQEFLEQKKEELAAIVAPMSEEVEAKFASGIDIKVLQGCLISFLDQWMEDIHRLAFEFLQFLPQELGDLLSTEDLRHGAQDVLMERIMSALFRCLQTLLGFTNLYEPNVMPTMDRGFQTDDEYRAYQRAAVYDEMKMGNAIQLNQLGYARIYQYYRRRDKLKQAEIKIANDSFLMMVENMFVVRVMADGSEEQVDLSTVKGVPLRTVKVTPQERCEMVLSRLAMIHGQWPDVCGEALVRYHLIGQHEETRSAVLELLNLGKIGELALPVMFSTQFIEYFRDTEIFSGICAEMVMRGVDIGEFASFLDPLFAELPDMPVRQMIHFMPVFLTMKAQDAPLLEDVSAKMFGNAPFDLLRQAFGVDEPSVPFLMQVVEFIWGYGQCTPADRIYWFGTYIRQASFQFCFDVLAGSGDYPLKELWEVVVNTAISFYEADNLEIMELMLMSIFQGSDLELLRQSVVILQAMRHKLDEGRNCQEEFLQATAPFLVELLIQAENIPEIYPVAIDLISSFIKAPEEGGTDYGEHMMEALGGAEGEAFIRAFASEAPEPIQQAVMQLIHNPMRWLLPSLIERVKNADALVGACLLLMEPLMQERAQEILDLLFLRLGELGNHTIIKTELLIEMIIRITPDMGVELRTVAFCLISQVKLINDYHFLSLVSRLLAEKTRLLGLDQDSEMRTVFTELIKYAFSKDYRDICIGLISLLPNPEKWNEALMDEDPNQIVLLMIELALSGEAWGWDLIAFSLSTEEVFEAASAVIVSLLESEEYRQRPAMFPVFMELFHIGVKKNHIGLCLKLISVLPGDPVIWARALLEKKRDAIKTILSMLAQAEAKHRVWSRNLALAFLISLNDLALLVSLISGDTDYGEFWDIIIKAFSMNPLTVEMVEEQDRMILEMLQIAFMRSEGRDMAMASLRQLIGKHLTVEGLPEEFIQFLNRMGALPA